MEWFDTVHRKATVLPLLLASFAASANEARPAATEADVGDKVLFSILYRSGPGWKPGVPMSEQGLRDHFLYMRDLDQRGRLVLAGPLGDDGGLVVLRADSQADAESVMAADPAVVDGIFSGQVLPFRAIFVGEPPPTEPRGN